MVVLMIKKHLLSLVCLCILFSPLCAPPAPVAAATPAATAPQKIDPKTGLPIPNAEDFFTQEPPPEQSSDSSLPLSTTEMGMIAGLGAGALAAGGLGINAALKRRARKKAFYESGSSPEGDTQDDVEEEDGFKKLRPGVVANAVLATEIMKGKVAAKKATTSEPAQPASVSNPSLDEKLKAIDAPVKPSPTAAGAQTGAPAADPADSPDVAKPVADTPSPADASPAAGPKGVVPPAAAGRDTTKQAEDASDTEEVAASGSSGPAASPADTTEKTVKVAVTPLEKKDQELKDALKKLKDDPKRIALKQAAADAKNAKVEARKAKDTTEKNREAKKAELVAATAEFTSLAARIKTSPTADAEQLAQQLSTLTAKREALKKTIKDLDAQVTELTKKATKASKTRAKAKAAELKAEEPARKQEAALKRQQEKLAPALTEEVKLKEELQAFDRKLALAKQVAAAAPEDATHKAYQQEVQRQYDAHAEVLKKHTKTALAEVEAAASETGQKSGILAALKGRISSFRAKKAAAAEDDDEPATDSAEATPSRWKRFKSLFKRKSSTPEDPADKSNPTGPKKPGLLKRIAGMVPGFRNKQAAAPGEVPKSDTTAQGQSTGPRGIDQATGDLAPSSTHPVRVGGGKLGEMETATGDQRVMLDGEKAHGFGQGKGSKLAKAEAEKRALIAEKNKAEDAALALRSAEIDAEVQRMKAAHKQKTGHDPKEAEEETMRNQITKKMRSEIRKALPNPTLPPVKPTPSRVTRSLSVFKPAGAKSPK